MKGKRIFTARETPGDRDDKIAPILADPLDAETPRKVKARNLAVMAASQVAVG